MKNLLKASIFLYLAAISLSFAPLQTPQQEIIEGVSVSGVQLGMTIAQVDSVLGARPETIVFGTYSYEHRYKKKGISVYEFQGDSTHSIFAITVHLKKWEGTTNQGLAIDKKLKIKDVITAYGSPVWWYTTDCLELDAEYEDRGIYFSVKPIKGTCENDENDHDTLFENKKVITVTIGRVGTEY